MTPTKVCNMMNKAYDVLKTMTVEEIKQASKVATIEMPLAQATLFQHQCRFALRKKSSGAWA